METPAYGYPDAPGGATSYANASPAPPPLPQPSAAAVAFRARSVPEILDAAFQLIRANYVQLALLSLVIASPALVLWAFVTDPALVRFVTLLQNFLTNFVIAAAVVVVSEAYLGRKVSFGQVMERVGDRFGSIWGAAIYRGFALVAGFLLLVLPVFIVMIITFAMPIVVMVEDASASESFERSKDLAKENWGRIALTSVLAVLLQYMAVFGSAFAMGLAMGSGTATQVLVQVIAVLLTPFPAVVGTVLYYDLRIRKEGFDIQMLMEAMNPSPARRRKFAF